MNTDERRLRWQSRRGLLELDLLLDIFWQKHGEHLTTAETKTLDELLLLSDEQLWRLLKKPSAKDDVLLQKLGNPLSQNILSKEASNAKITKKH